MDLKLSGRVAVVTGASKGIGLAVTRSLLAEGAKVVAVSRKSTPDLDGLAGPNLLHVSADLMDPQAPGQVVARAVEHFGGLDILVNNAGGPPPGISMPRTGFFECVERLGRFSGPPDGTAAASWHAAEVVRVFEFNYPTEQ